MPRKPTILQSDFPYHISSRCINRDWFSIPMDTVWNIMSEQLHFVSHAYSLDIHAFVLMDSHYHLIARTPLANVSEAMGWFNRETSRALTRSGNRINQTYGGRYFRSIIGTDHYYRHAYKYLYSNPIQAGIVKNILDYPYSTLPGLLGKQKLIIPVVDDTTLFSDIRYTLNWINRPVEFEDWKTVKNALRRTEFTLPSQNRKPHRLEIDML